MRERRDCCVQRVLCWNDLMEERQRLSLSCGSDASILTVSKSIPRKSRAVVGRTVLEGSTRNPKWSQIRMKMLSAVGGS